MGDNSKDPFLEMFEDAERVSTYADGPPRFTPGFFDMHRMTGVLIRERVPDDARILVHGCGGGLELETFARENAGWRLTGVDPAEPMLEQARLRLGSLSGRVDLHHGYIDSAPDGPFDAATSLLTLHFLDFEARVKTVRGILQRLKSGAPLVVVHSSIPEDDQGRDTWLSRYQNFAIASGVDPDMANGARQAVEASSTMLNPEQDVDVLNEAGLTNVSVFYTAFTWRGWVGYAP